MSPEPRELQWHDLRPEARDNSPLYLQVAKRIGNAITEGRFLANEALPSERTLAETIGVSRVTARKALEQLERQRLIVRRHGSGNYIAPQVEQPLSHLTSFSEELFRRGHVPSSRWLKRAVTAAQIDERRRLGLDADARVARLERLRLADEVVMAYELTVLPEWVLPRPQALSGSLYEHLALVRHAPVRAVQQIRALNAPPRLAKRLGVDDGHAVLLFVRTGYLASGRAVELTHAYCRSDYYGFIAEMNRTPSRRSGDGGEAGAARLSDGLAPEPI